MPAHEPSIRDARPEDWEAVAELLQQLGRPSALGTEIEEEPREVYGEFLSRPDAAALAAEDDGRVVGFCDLLFLPRLNFAGPQAWIPDLVVSANERGRRGPSLSRGALGARAGMLERLPLFRELADALSRFLPPGGLGSERAVLQQEPHRRAVAAPAARRG